MSAIGYLTAITTPLGVQSKDRPYWQKSCLVQPDLVMVAFLAYLTISYK
ncbi:hypothetical protein D1BOALGB6SA_2870 [Olavius sp. associated proteobacterium Delta 1]|nr:hypothetical protein D1BOALGB6SA_2870 [Olavius sp. associated proteobacterium Delta 1]